MIGLRRHTFVFQASLSNVYPRLERRDLDRTMSFRSPDSVHSTYSLLFSLSSSPELALAAGPCELAAGSCEFAAGP